jgi:hypothetical protein
VSIALVELTLPVRTAESSAKVLTPTARRCDVKPAVKLAMMTIELIIQKTSR